METVPNGGRRGLLMWIGPRPIAYDRPSCEDEDRSAGWEGQFLLAGQAKMEIVDAHVSAACKAFRKA